MNWDDSYTVSRSIVLQIGNGGELLAGNSVSRMPQALSHIAGTQNLRVDLA